MARNQCEALIMTGFCKKGYRLAQWEIFGCYGGDGRGFGQLGGSGVACGLLSYVFESKIQCDEGR